jgi:probable rRNA maturation factor
VSADEDDAARVSLQVAVQTDCEPSLAAVRAWAAAAFSAAERGVAHGEVTVRLVGEGESRALNERFRNVPKATNVLAFPAGAAVVSEFGPVDELGDLVICMPVVSREAREQSIDTIQHLAHLVIHGILHLIGYDHAVEADAANMEARERRAMAVLGYPDPYRHE